MTQQYPGSPTSGPTPATGQARRVTLPPPPVVGSYSNTQNLTIPSETAVSNKVDIAPNTVETAVKNTVVIPVGAPIGAAEHTPLLTPLGVYPQFETPTEDWTWDYGNGQ